MKQLRLNDENCFVFYRQLPQTGWSMAIIYPENEIFQGYNRLFYIVLAIIFVGLLLLFILCRKIINNAIMPVNQLANLRGTSQQETSMSIYLAATASTP